MIIEYSGAVSDEKDRLFVRLITVIIQRTKGPVSQVPVQMLVMQQ